MSESRRDFFRSLFGKETLRSLAPLADLVSPVGKLDDILDAARSVRFEPMDCEEAGLELGRRNRDRDVLSRRLGADLDLHIDLDIDSSIIPTGGQSLSGVAGAAEPGTQNKEAEMDGEPRRAGP